MIAAERLAAAYGERIIFEDVSFSLGQGRLGLICGPNGAGKSTLLRILAGLARPLRGSARPGGHSPGAVWLGHRPAVYPALTVLENLEFWKTAGGMRHARTDIWLERFGLAAFIHEPAGHLSRGLIQRLALARTFMGEASILLLDEPTAALDPVGEKALLDALAHSLGRGACVMLATHDPGAFAGLDPVSHVLGRSGLLSRGAWPPASEKSEKVWTCFA